MQGLLLLAGFMGVLGGAGAAAYGYLHPEFRFADNGLIAGIIAGAILLIGGLLMLGLSVALRRLQRIAETMEARAMPRAVVDAVDAPVMTAIPAPARPTAAGLAAVSETLNATDARPAPGSSSAAPEIPSPAASPEPGPQSTEWPRVDPSDRVVRAEGAAAESAVATVTPPVADGGAPEISEPVRVLKSGVIDGMAYTLYSDGSVDAELKGNTLHFASIAQWRAHLRENA